MNASTSAQQEYLKNAVLTASPEQLQLMLLDAAIRFATRGLEALRASDREGALHALERAQRITLELGLGLNPDVNPPLVEQMRSLYNFCYRRLVDANMQQNQQAILDAVRILKHQRDTWTLLAEKVRTETTADGRAAPARPVTPASLAAARISAPSPVADANIRFVAEG